MRPEDELLKMVRGRNPMDLPEMPDEEMMMDEGPPMAPPDMPPDMGMEDQMMPEAPPQADIPQSATVEEIRGSTVVLTSETGQPIELPLGAFPIPPQEGMRMVQAEVMDVGDGVIIAMVGNQEVELPLSEASEPFNVGDYFWLPEPPASPDEFTEQVV